MITINRESAYADMLRSYKIVLDGNIVGKVANGESKSFEAKAGNHTLTLRIDWARSNTLSFELKDDETMHFNCVSSLKGSRIWLAVIYVLFLPYKYIQLKQIQ